MDTRKVNNPNPEISSTGKPKMIRKKREKKLKIAFLGKSEISFELLIIAYKPRFKDISNSDNERACPIFGRSGK